MNNEQSLRDMLLKYNEPRRGALSGVSSARRPVQAGAKEYSPEELKALLATLSNMGVGRDELIAHITADEARLLKARGGSGQRNPRTGLLSFDDGGSGYGDGDGESYGGESYGGESYGGEGYGGEGMDWSGFNDSYNANSLSDMFGDISNYEGYDSSMDDEDEDEDEDPDMLARGAVQTGYLGDLYSGFFGRPGVPNTAPGIYDAKDLIVTPGGQTLWGEQPGSGASTAGAPFGGLGGFGGRGEASPYGGVSAGPLSTGDVNMVTYSNAGLTPWSQEMLDDEQQQQATTGTQTAGTTGTQTAETTGGRGAVTNDNLGTIDVTADLGGTFTNDGSGGEDDYRRRRYIGATGVAPERGDPAYIEWLRLTADGGNNDYARGGSTNQGLRRLYRKYARGGSV
jgi:hypothetical protein